MGHRNGENGMNIARASHTYFTEATQPLACCACSEVILGVSPAGQVVTRIKSQQQALQ